MSGLTNKRSFWLTLSFLLHTLLLVGFRLWPPIDEPTAADSSIATTPHERTLKTQLITDFTRPPEEKAASTALLTGAGASVVIENKAPPLDPSSHPESSESSPAKDISESTSLPEKVETVPPELPLKDERELQEVKEAEADEVVAEEPTREPLADPAPTPPAAIDPTPTPIKRATTAPPLKETTETGALGRKAAESKSARGDLEGTVASLIRGPLPPYPRSARNMGITGVTTTLDVEINKRGQATRIKVLKSSGHQALDRSAQNTVRRKWQFKPAIDASGKAVASHTTITIDWQLE